MVLTGHATIVVAIGLPGSGPDVLHSGRLATSADRLPHP